MNIKWNAHFCLNTFNKNEYRILFKRLWNHGVRTRSDETNSLYSSDFQYKKTKKKSFSFARTPIQLDYIHQTQAAKSSSFIFSTLHTGSSLKNSCVRVWVSLFLQFAFFSRLCLHLQFLLMREKRTWEFSPWNINNNFYCIHITISLSLFLFHALSLHPNDAMNKKKQYRIRGNRSSSDE